MSTAPIFSHVEIAKFQLFTRNSKKYISVKTYLKGLKDMSDCGSKLPYFFITQSEDRTQYIKIYKCTLTMSLVCQQNSSL